MSTLTDISKALGVPNTKTSGNKPLGAADAVALRAFPERRTLLVENRYYIYLACLVI